MSKADPTAAASGPQNTDAPEAQPPSGDALRSHAAARLAEQLDIGADLLARCEHFANLPKGDRLGAVYAAARLMRANAMAAQALGQLAEIERLESRIAKHIQSPVPDWTDSNSILEESLPRELNLTMLRYMKLIAEETLGPALREGPETDAPAATHPAPRT